MPLTLNINGKSHDLGTLDPSTPLLWALRDHLGLVGTKYGCGQGICGACTVHINGQPTRSCILPVNATVGMKITTIEGLAKGDKLTAVQKVWCDQDVAQCGYCQSGQLMAASALLARTAKPTDEDIDAAMSGNLCRCGTYTRIRQAIHTAAALPNS